MALCRAICGVIKQHLRRERELHIHYISIIDDLVITTPLKNDIAALWSCSGRPGASRRGARCRFAVEALHG